VPGGTFGDDVAEEITTWSTVQKKPTGITRSVASFANVGEVGGRREQLLRAGRGPLVVDVSSLHVFALPVIVT